MEGPMRELTWLSIISLNKYWHSRFTQNFAMKIICGKLRRGQNNNGYEIKGIVNFNHKKEYDLHFHGFLPCDVIKTYFGTFYLHDMSYFNKSTAHHDGKRRYFDLGDRAFSKQQLYEYCINRIFICHYDYFHNEYYEGVRKKNTGFCSIF
jgi:hypothetical protein